MGDTGDTEALMQQQAIIHPHPKLPNYFCLPDAVTGPEAGGK